MRHTQSPPPFVNGDHDEVPRTPMHSFAVPMAVRVDEDDKQYDANGVRVWEWESWPCGRDCWPNWCMTLWCPCVSAAQIAHRLDNSYGWVLFAWGLCYSIFLISLIAGTRFRAQWAASTAAGAKPTVSFAFSDTAAATLSTVFSLGVLAGGTMCAGVTCMLRDETRRRYALQGTYVEDFCCAFCCPWCALTQMATHLKSYKTGMCSFGCVVDVLPPYLPEEIESCRI